MPCGHPSPSFTPAAPRPGPAGSQEQGRGTAACVPVVRAASEQRFSSAAPTAAPHPCPRAGPNQTCGADRGAVRPVSATPMPLSQRPCLADLTGSWVSKFPAEMTHKHSFRLSEREVVKVPMMHTKGAFLAAGDPGAGLRSAAAGLVGASACSWWSHTSCMGDEDPGGPADAPGSGAWQRHDQQVPRGQGRGPRSL